MKGERGFYDLMQLSRGNENDVWSQAGVGRTRLPQ
jgi:hypothetical protein